MLIRSSYLMSWKRRVLAQTTAVFGIVFLGFLEPETNRRYPDLALQINLDLSHVSYMATANSVDPLPGPIRDRFRIVIFPKPTRDDLDALLPAVIGDFAQQRDLDRRWILPLDGDERAAVAAHWRGGSIAPFTSNCSRGAQRARCSNNKELIMTGAPRDRQSRLPLLQLWPRPQHLFQGQRNQRV